jgi:DNA repair protein RecO (recombination protein O)
MTLLAKGFKSGKKQRKSFLQPFRKLSIAWVGRGELKTLTTAEEMEAPLVLEDKALMSGLYVNELLMRLLHPHDPHAEIFELYEQTLSALSTSVTLELVLRTYEKNILEALGYGLLLDTDVEGAALDPQSLYCYLSESGPVKTDKPVSGGVLLSGKTLLLMNSGKLDGEQALKESKLLMRYILSHYIGEKPLKTRELFRYY